jgi:nicotinamide mononucleotide adenylyltransferase
MNSEQKICTKYKLPCIENEKRNMPEMKLQQLQYESNTWKRVLGFMTEENVHLKNRLSQILKEKFNAELLEEAEVFQSNFVKEDELISLLRNDIVELDKLLEREMFEDGNTINEVKRKLQKIRSNMEIAEKQFGTLKSVFNSYFFENI